MRECFFITFADDMTLRRAETALEGKLAIPRGPDELDGWTNQNLRIANMRLHSYRED